METPRTKLTIITPEDYQELLEMYAEEDTFKYIKPLQNKTREEYLDMMVFRLEQSLKNEGYYWIARHNDNKDLVGALNLNPFRDTGRIQLGYQISRKYWNLGFATELGKAGLDFGFNQWKLKRIHAFVVPEHHASKKVLQKLGFLLLDGAFALADEPPLEMYGVDRN